MKYIVIKVGSCEVPILFPELIFHVDIAKLMSNKIVSAGFVEQSSHGLLRCFGHSEGLEIKSRPALDTLLINNELKPTENSTQKQ